MEEQLIQAYKEMLVSGEENINAFTLSQKVGATEQDFYKHFTSADDIGRKIWANIGEEVFAKLNESETFANYGAREKILTVYFTFFEVALNHRVFISLTNNRPSLLKTYRENFKQFVNDVIQEGIATDEVKERLSLSSYYPDMLWGLHQRLISFWLNDTSENFVETDKAIEVYSKVPLEFMGHNLFDSLYETAKFNFEQLNLDKYNWDDLKVQFPQSISNIFRK